MCQFCLEHGEGKKWYLQMKSYSQELLHQELSARQQEIVGTKTRLEFINQVFEETVVPAMGAMAGKRPETPPAQPPAVRLSEDEMLARRRVSHFGQVLPIEDVEKVIDLADSITRLPCGCRFLTTGKADQRYCFGLGLDKWGVLGNFPDAASSLEVLDKEEARKAFRGLDEEGLVHTIWTAVTPYVLWMCNCDHDCLGIRRYIEQDGSPRFFRAEIVCQVDWDLCTGCKECMRQCQFGAQFYSSALGKVYINPARCFGCGLCKTACPHGAISSLPRQEHPQAADLWLKGTSK